jgi:uncharacterized protein (DUF1501 family)
MNDKISSKAKQELARLSRRRFLRLASAGTCGAAIHGLIPSSSSWLALAEPATRTALSPNSILIVVNLSGGCSYNIAPVYHGTYRDRNPTISYGPEDSLALNAEQGLHPSLTALKSVYDEGRMALVNMVGYPNPNRSHDESTNIWFSAMRSMSASVGGWGARLTCQMDSIFSGISLGGSNLLISGDCNPPRSYGSLDTNAFGERGISGMSSTHKTFFQATRDSMIADAAATDKESLLFVRGQIDNLSSSLQVIQQATSRALPNIAPVTFPNSGFGNACRDAAKLINAPELRTRFIFLQRGGFDTHSGERAALTGNLTDVNAGLAGLIAVAKAANRWQDVTIVTMSEFCRTFENGSQGTDHGHAAPMLVAGGSIRGGVLTPTPTPAETSGREYYHGYHIDFRSVFAEITAAMGANPAVIFPEAFQFSSLGIIT